MRKVALCGWLLCALVACREPDQLKNAQGDIAWQTGEVHEDLPRVDFGELWVDSTQDGIAELHNRGRSKLTLEWELPANASFELIDPPNELQSGSTEIHFRFRSDRPGEHTAKVVARSGPSHFATLSLRALAKGIPPCPTPVSCHTAVFDKATGTCVETALVDGTACSPNSACVTDAVCQGGRCVGTPIQCDDGNACTLNTCNAVTGCEYPPAPPCPGDGKCGIGVCDPTTGCGIITAADGTRCGAVSCDMAMVCISGTCQERDPPDGYVCAEASPCQGEGFCQGSDCVKPPAIPLTANWSLDSALPETALNLHDFILEPSGELSLMGFFSRPIVRASAAAALPLDGTARRCIEWNGQLACADYAELGPNGSVVLLDMATGAQKWTFTLSAERPDFVQITETLFMARIAAMGSDRLAALFEAYPKNSVQGTQCRDYFLVVLDAGGGMVSAQKLTDPLLATCNHPHPYGVASDTLGNLYLSFSPSSNGTAPLAALSPTLMMSFTRDGVMRWKKTRSELGGELAVANGLLFSEGSQYALSTGNGEVSAPAAPMPSTRETLGRVVADDARYVTSPNVSPLLPRRTLNAYRVDGAEAWSWDPGAGARFLTRELRAVSYQSKLGEPAHSAVLTFVDRGGQTELVAVGLQQGEELWSCPVDEPSLSVPQLFEVANGSFAVMGGALTCGDCDPPFANSDAAFYRFAAPGVKPSSIPWSGTFGGPGHDHHENGPSLSLPSTSSQNPTPN